MATARKKAKGPTQSEIAKIILADVRPSADSSGLLRDLVHEWGGTAALARDIRQEFSSAGKGSQTRQRILEMVQRLVIMNTQHDLSKSISPSSMTDEDLQRVAIQMIAKVSNGGTSGADSESEG